MAESIDHYLDDLLNSDGWTDPIPLASTAGDTAPPFPVGCLPQWMQPHVLAVAAEQQVAVDLPAMLGIAALALVNAKRHRVHIQAEWYEPLNLYLVVALPPSAGKSPVFRRFFRVVEQHETELAAEAGERAERVNQQRRIIEKRMHKAEQAGDDIEAQIALDDLRNLPPVTIPRLLADDITVERLVDMLREQDGRLGLISTEGGLFDAMAGRYSDKSNLDPYLQAWSGDTIRTDRVARGATIVPDPHLTIGLTVQPAVIEALAAKPEFRGRGLTARFMYAIPEDFVGRRNFLTTPPGDQNAADTYTAHILTALRQPLPETPYTLELTSDAHQRFSHWRNALERRRTPNGDLRPMAEWTTKLESSTARLAGLFAIADGANHIDIDTIGRAIDVGDYWLAHARIAHDLWGRDGITAAAGQILQWLRERHGGDFSMRDVYRERKGLFATAEMAVAPLELLVDHGWIRPVDNRPIVAGRRGVPSPRFLSHPTLSVDNSNNCNNHGALVTLGVRDKFEVLSSSSSVSVNAQGIGDMSDKGDMTKPNPPVENPF